MRTRLRRGPVVFVAVLSATVLGWLGVISALVLDLVCLGAMICAVVKLPGAAAVIPRGLSWGVGAAALTLLVLRFTQPDIRFMPYLLIFPANLIACYIFARGLFPKREPMLLSLIKLMGRQPVDDPDFIAFVRGQCLFWAVVSLMTAMLALLCIPFGRAIPEMATALGGIIALQLIWFPLSHIYANWRYNRVETFWNTIVMLGRPEARALLSLR